MSAPFALTNTIAIHITADADEAIAAGHVYHDGYKAVRLEHAVVVKNGTVSGNATVDLVFVDEQGNKYMTMITGNLLNSVTACF